jgi:glycosyltransferase involved in cell wall biosynthesis
VTVLVPARNEAGNIERILAEVPEMGAFTELIFVEGNSTDNTWAVLEKAVAERKCPNVRLLKQPGKGKGDAVRHGFAAARGDILMILDADLTVPAEMLPRFYNAVASGHAEFANGTRLVYRMDEKAMQFLNLLANHFFAHAFTFVLSQPVRDTLCGTKALSRRSYEKIVAQREYFGDFDPFGDFDLLFGAARLGLRIRDIPIRYRERVYGETNISRFRHGIMLFRMLWIAALKLKFR